MAQHWFMSMRNRHKPNVIAFNRLSVIRSKEANILTQDEIDELMSNKELIEMLDETFNDVLKDMGNHK